MTGIAVRPDGRFLASASRDGTVRIWSPGRSPVVGMKLCRFAPGELDPYVRSIRHLPAEAEIHVRVAGARTTLRSE